MPQGSATMSAVLDLDRSAVARYLQLSSLFRRRIEYGEWAVGQQIPTLEQLTAECGVAPATIRKALDSVNGEEARPASNNSSSNTLSSGGLETLAQALLEYETLSGQEIKDLLEKGLAPNRDENNFPNAGPSVSVPITPVSDGVTVEPTVH